MKRSNLARKTPLQARKPISRGKLMKARPKRKATSDVRWRSPEYLAFVRSLPCSLCAMGPSDAHHITGLHLGLSGMGIKPSDIYTMPLCRSDHSMIHSTPSLHKLQIGWTLSTIKKAINYFNNDKILEESRLAIVFLESKGEEHEQAY